MVNEKGTGGADGCRYNVRAGGFDALGIIGTEYRLSFQMNNSEPEADVEPHLIPVYATDYRGNSIQLNALTGEHIGIGSTFKE